MNPHAAAPSRDANPNLEQRRSEFARWRGQFDALESRMAQLFLRRGASIETALGAILASRAEAQGDSFVALEQFSDAGADVSSFGVESNQNQAARPVWPTLERWDQALRACAWTHTCESDAPFQMSCASGKALVYVPTPTAQLYLRRLWHEECALAAALQARLAVPARAPTPPSEPQETRFAWLDPALDALVSSAAPLIFLTGGPGTGKTTAAAQLALACLLQHALPPDCHNPTHAGRARLMLLAPTGKAAARLTEAFQAQLPGLQAQIEPVLGARAWRRIGQLQASTLHRALGYNPALHRFAHHAGTPLDADVVLLDEASMISTQMLLALLSALAPGARLLLLGDAMQLSAVETGTPFRSVLRWLGKRYGGFDGPEAVLRRSEQTILSPVRNGPSLRLIKQWRADAALAHACASLAAIEFGEGPVNFEGSAEQMRVAVAELEAYRQDLTEQLSSLQLEQLVQPWWAMFEAADAQAALNVSLQFRVLCAVHQSKRGQLYFNQLIERSLLSRYHPALMRQLSMEREFDLQGGHYRGRLLMATENNYEAQVMNGDIGICWPDQQGQLKLHMASNQGLRSLWPQQIHGLVPAFAMTVHKAQGSEFDAVAVILPHAPSSDPASQSTQRVMHRALLYTALTRAKRQVHIYGEQQALQLAVETQHSPRHNLEMRLDQLLGVSR